MSNSEYPNGDAVALRASERRYRDLVETMPHGMEEVDLQGRIVFANAALGRILGYPPEELIGTYIWERHAEPHEHEDRREYFQYLKENQPPPEPYFGTNLTGDGRRIEIRFDWDYKRDESGNLVGFVGVVTDVTETVRNREALDQARRELENRVERRTSELAEANQRLEQEIGSRRDAEQKLRESHDFLQSVIDALSAHVAVLDADGRIVLVNRMWREFADNNGLADSDYALGTNYLAVCRAARGPWSEEAPVAAEGILEVLQGRRDRFYLEYPCHSTEPGDPLRVIQNRWFQMRAARFLYDERPWVIVAHENVTELKSIAEKLRQSEARYRSISQLVTNHAYSFRLDEDGSIRNEWTSGHFSEITGYSLQEMGDLGGWESIIHPDDLARTLRRKTRLMAGEQDVTEFRIVSKAGQVRWLRDYAQPIRNQHGGRVERIVGAAQDITKRKEREEALRASEERFRVVFESSPLGICTAAPDDRILAANPAFCRIVGYSTDELLGMEVDELTHPDDLEADRAAKLVIEETRSETYTLEKRYVRKDKTDVWVHVTATGVFNPEGGLAYGLVVVEDVTERKRAEEMLRRAERLAAIGTLAAGIAHEVNNPLHGITLYSEAALLAKEHPDAGATRDQLLRKIQDEAMRCGRLVRSVLQFARRERTEKWPCPIGQLIRQAADLTRQQADRRKVQVELALPDDLPSLSVNPTAIEQVFVNLLANAVQACEADGHVTITARADASCAQVRIEDDGRGMSEEQTRQIFDPFYTTRLHRGGTGLGMSISYGIVQDHGGSIDISSKLGAGTAVTVTLPRERSPNAKEPGDGPNPRG